MTTSTSDQLPGGEAEDHPLEGTLPPDASETPAPSESGVTAGRTWTRWKWRGVVALVGALVLIAAATVAGYSWGRSAAPPPAVSLPESGSPGPGGSSSAPAILSEEPAADVAAALAPSVVQIESPGGLGSGVIYDDAGHILTAAHVIEGATRVRVRLSDGSRVEGTVVGTDPASDVGVVSIDHRRLVPAPLAVGEPLRVGQLAIALGSPYGLEGTVTAGVVSAVNRSVTGVDGSVRSMIQTDAPINPGNSGGPLVDRNGRVIGINDSIFSRSGGNEGVGFAIPIDQAKSIADRLVAGEPIQTAYLGVSGTDPASGAAGALVSGVEPGSAAADAGLQVGDLITAVEGTPVFGFEDLAAAIRSSRPGDRVTLDVTRGGSELSIDVTLGELSSPTG